MEILYNGKKYRNIYFKWVDEDFIAVPASLQRELDAHFYKDIDVHGMKKEEAVELADSLKKAESFEAAAQIYEKLCETLGYKESRYIYPKLCSCYRGMHASHKVIDLMKSIKTKHGARAISPVLLTSAAAAYCDIGDLESAKICADKAYALNDGRATYELTLVYRRLNKLSRE